MHMLEKNVNVVYSIPTQQIYLSCILPIVKNFLYMAICLYTIWLKLKTQIRGNFALNN